MSDRRIAAIAPSLEAEAGRIDREGGQLSASVELLRQHGILRAPLPVALGGEGLGTSAAGAPALLSLLRAIGHADLSLGRLFEGHVNAVRLAMLYGGDAQRDQVAREVRDGHLFGLWVTDTDPVRLRRTADGFVLRGEKRFASGALLATRALVTAQPEHEAPRMAIVALGVERGAGLLGEGMTGMRGAATGWIDLSGIAVGPGRLIGQPGDYLRQPEFSAGAWRGSAVALGGIDRLVDGLRETLAGLGRDDDPHQRVRIGEALIARETAAFWAERAALLADGEGFEAGDVAGTVNLARIACERAALDVIELVQRGLGLRAFARGTAIERVLRDLATYLRQPAPDETLAEAAGWFTRRDLPRPDLPRPDLPRPDRRADGAA